MKTILANKLFEDKKFLNTVLIEEDTPLNLDFRGVKDFNLNNLYALLNLQKIATFNNVRITFKNTTPVVEKVLFETGIYKTIEGFSTNPILASKRLNFS